MRWSPRPPQPPTENIRSYPRERVRLPQVLRPKPHCYFSPHTRHHMMFYYCLCIPYYKIISNTSVAILINSKVDTHIVKRRDTPIARVYRCINFSRYMTPLDAAGVKWTILPRAFSGCFVIFSFFSLFSEAPTPAPSPFLPNPTWKYTTPSSSTRPSPSDVRDQTFSIISSSHFLLVLTLLLFSVYCKFSIFTYDIFFQKP